MSDSKVSKAKLYTVPLTFNGTVPDDRILFDAMQKFFVAEFGSNLDVSHAGKVWLQIKISNTDEGYEVIGIAAVRMIADCFMFHVKSGTEGDESSWLEARETSKALMTRARGHIQDSLGVGSKVLIYIEPTVERFWRGFLRLIGAKPADRYILEV